MRQYDDPVEVRRGETDGPEQFLWRGRLWKVRSVLEHWVDPVTSWQGSEVWRVEATRGPDVAGVFDLSFTSTDGRWQLVPCAA